MTTIVQNVHDIEGAQDNAAWVFYTQEIRASGGGGGITSTKKVRSYPASGFLTVQLDPGPAVVIAPDGNHYPFLVPQQDSQLWPLIQAAVAIPPSTAQEKLQAAVAALGVYSKPAGGIPGTDLDAASQRSLAKAETAFQPPAVVGAGATQLAAIKALGLGVISNGDGTLTSLLPLGVDRGDATLTYSPLFSAASHGDGTITFG